MSCYFWRRTTTCTAPSFRCVSVALWPPSTVAPMQGCHVGLRRCWHHRCTVMQPIEVESTQPPPFYQPPRVPERILMCGWRRDISDVIDLLDSMVLPGSELHLLSQVDPDTRVLRFSESGLEVRVVGSTRWQMQ